jgi:hypothetical protein
LTLRQTKLECFYSLIFLSTARSLAIECVIVRCSTRAGSGDERNVLTTLKNIVKTKHSSLVCQRINVRPGKKKFYRFDSSLAAGWCPSTVTTVLKRSIGSILRSGLAFKTFLRNFLRLLLPSGCLFMV